MKSKKISVYVILWSLAISAQASCNLCSNHRWELTTALGGGWYDHMLGNDGQTVIGRLSLGHSWNLALPLALTSEIGVQNGNRMRLDVARDIIESQGGEPINLQIKPTIDILAGLRIPFGSSGIYAGIKMGGVYRQLQIDRESINDLKQWSLEAMLGLGYQVTKNASLTLSYQRMFGQTPTVQSNPEKEVALLRGMPTQQVILLGVSFQF